MRLRYLLAFALFTSFTKELVNKQTPIAPIAKVTTTQIDKGTLTNIKMLYYQLLDGADQSANGVIYYENHIIFSPANSNGYTSPIHLIKSNNAWALESAKYGDLMDRPRNTIKVTNGTVVWANASKELSNFGSGNLYLSKTNPDKSLTWKKLSSRDAFYHYATAGDIDNDGNPEIISYVGAETESPEWLEVFGGPNYDKIEVTMPSAAEFEAALGFTKADKNKVGAGFSFGSITVANIDLTTSQNELVLTSTKALMNEYYSFIILNYDQNTKKFKITKIIKPSGLLLEYQMGVGDVKAADFNGDNNTDLVVTMGNHKTNEYSGVQVWLNDGKGNLIANKKKSELYSKENKNIIFFSNIEVGKFRGHDCVFLHYEGTRYVPTIQNNLDLSPFLLISAGDDGGFTHLPELKVSGLVPTFMKGYFEKQNNVDVLRLIGMKDVGPNEFNLTDITIK